MSEGSDRQARATPLLAEHEARGAKLVEFAGWMMPVRFEGVLEEHRATRQAAGLFDVSHMGEIAVEGSEAEEFLQRLTPNDVAKLRTGRAHYTGLLTEEGTYIDDLLIYRRGDDRFLLVVNASNVAEDLAWLHDHAPESVSVTDRSDDYALIALQGPASVAILQLLVQTDLDELRYYGFVETSVAGVPTLLSRTGYTGEDGFELYVRPEKAAALWRSLLAAGEPHGVVPAGLGARDTLRLEAGMALYGHEIDRATTPWEAGLNWVVKLAKGDFVGREALVAQKEAGVPRKLVGLELQERGIARQGYAVSSGGEAVGTVTSGTMSPTLERSISMASVAADRAATGTRLEVDVRGKGKEAVVVDLPFYKRPK